MLDHDALMELYRELEPRKVLSVYLDAEQHDPAERNKWRVRLEHEVNRIRRELEGGESERVDFDQAWLRMREPLEAFDAFLPQRGWVGFATADRLWYGENVPVPMPDGVFWEEGMRVAPYVRGLKQARPVVVLIVDSQRARIFRYLGGEVTELEDCRADMFIGDPTDVNVSKRAVSHTGVRGETSTDAARHLLVQSSQRLLKHALAIVGERCGPHTALVLGGNPEIVVRAKQELPKHLHGRSIEAPSLYLDVGDAELRGIVELAASTLTRRLQYDLLEQVMEAAGPGGKACLGRDETLKALDEMRVDTLLLSRKLIQADPDLADHSVGSALAQNAAVEELSDEGAARLDHAGGGIGARLRYRVRTRGGRRDRETAGGGNGRPG